MTDGNRAKRNRKIRQLIGGMVDPLQPGQRIKTEKILVSLQARDHRWGLNTFMIRNLVREREDLRWIGEGTWEKVRV